MKSLTEHLWFEVPNRRGFVNITDMVEALVTKSGVKDGLCLVNAMHITASVFINDAESGLLQDYEAWLEKLAPHAPTSQYLHNRTGEDNADAHMKRQIMGREVVVAITKCKLDFGPWEQIFYGEFDGRRRKRALVKVIGERFGYSQSSSLAHVLCKTSATLLKELPRSLIHTDSVQERTLTRSSISHRYGSVLAGEITPDGCKWLPRQVTGALEVVRDAIDTLPGNDIPAVAGTHGLDLQERKRVGRISLASPFLPIVHPIRVRIGVIRRPICGQPIFQQPGE
jgi:secondary thiamine-phosphate synthase enzyme